jgi:phosphoadenosine phosphosulfate reductase
MNKIEFSIKMIQNNEPASPYHVAFSGGKDSIVLYDLVKKSGVKHQAFFCRTSIDYKELLRFIHINYSEVIHLKPAMTMFQLILKKKMLPIRQIRYCCGYLKEYAGAGEVVLTGVRREESNKRKTYDYIARKGDKIEIRPLLEWTEKDIWNYIDDNKLVYPKFYDDGFKRLGCVGCPMATPKQKMIEFSIEPNIKKAYIKTIQKLIDIGKFSDFIDAEEVFDWWISNTPKKKYMYNKRNVQRLIFNNKETK